MGKIYVDFGSLPESLFQKASDDTIQKIVPAESEKKSRTSSKELDPVQNSTKKVQISDECSACGLCLATDSSLFAETPEGKAIIKGAGIVANEKLGKIKELIDLCPSHAISILDANIKTKAAVKQLIKEKLKDYKLPIPPRSAFCLNKDSINFPIPYSTNEHFYRYGSYNQAKKAGMEEFNRLMFSQRKIALERIFIEYKAQVILPYYRYEKNTTNFYYKIQQQLEKMLLEIIDEVKLVNPKAEIPKNYEQIPINIDSKKFDILEYFKTGFEQAQANRALDELSSDCYSFSSYELYFDIDDTEEYAGTGLFGGDKYVTKYCFYNLAEAFRELSKDLMGACDSVINDSVDEAYSFLECLWKYVEKEMKDLLNNKAAYLEKKMD